MSFTTTKVSTVRKIFINNNQSVIEKVVNNIQQTIKNDNRFRWSLTHIRQLLIKSAELIDKRQCLYDHPCLSAKQQSVSWHFINEFLECELDNDLLSALNHLLVSMGMAFDYAGTVAAEGIDLTALDVARDLNETMKLLDYPFTFHPDVYGKSNSEALRNRAGKSSLRRPIAKAELVLAWAAHLLRLTRPLTKFTKNELTFINLLGTILNAFVQRYELIVNIKYHQPCLDQLAFIRLLEIVYIACIDRSNKDINIYSSWYDKPDRFNYISDFNDIRLSLNPLDIRSHLSLLPRMASAHPQGKTVYYNPVDCIADSPIALATKAWMDATEVMRDDCSFDTIVRETSKASFEYESQFAVQSDDPINELPEWLANVRIFELTDTEDEALYAEQSKAIEDHLTTIKKEIEEDLANHADPTKETPSIVFSVMLKSNADAKPELSFIKL